jgi:hypothetical protein
MDVETYNKLDADFADYRRWEQGPVSRVTQFALPVIPAKAGIQSVVNWTPTFAGVTVHWATSEICVYLRPKALYSLLRFSSIPTT